MDKDKPIIALDFKKKEKAIHFLRLFNEETLNVKIGMELFYASGPDFVKEVVEKGHQVFLDLKLYDIPNTVHQAMVQLAKLGVAMVNVHASGGLAMMQAAKEGLEIGTDKQTKRPILIGVTQLTSRKPDENMREMQLAVSQKESILHLAKLTKKSGLDGVVCSPLEVEQIKRTLGQDFLTITPGIRLGEQLVSNDDQVRVATPKKAREMGSDYIVVGRPITNANHPKTVYHDIETAWIKARKQAENE